MATIRRRKTKTGENRYFVEVRRRGYPPIRKTFVARAAAKAWAKDIEAEIQRRHLLPRLEADKHTLSDAIDRYLEDHLDELKAGGSQADRRRQLEWWRHQLGDLSLSNLTPAVISDARRQLLKDRRLSGPTSNRYLAALSAVFRHATREWMWLTENPVARVSRKKENPGRVRYLSEDERDRLLEACQRSSSRRLYPLVLFALATGARQGELLRLRWEDVDLPNRRAVIQDSKNRDRRTIFFQGRAGEVLHGMAKTPHISGYLFGHSAKAKTSFPKTAWETALRKAAIEDFRFHDLRHTAASYMAMSGASLPQLAAFLGHRTLEMVRRYSHLADQYQESAAAKMVSKFLP